MWVTERAKITLSSSVRTLAKKCQTTRCWWFPPRSLRGVRGVRGMPMTHSEQPTGNPFAIVAPGAKSEIGYLLTHQPKSFDWRERCSRSHSTTITACEFGPPPDRRLFPGAGLPSRHPLP